MAVGDSKMRMNLTLTKELNWLVEAMAEEDGRSKNSMILYMVYEALKSSKQIRDLLTYIDDEYIDYNSYKEDRRLIKLFKLLKHEMKDEEEHLLQLDEGRYKNDDDEEYTISNYLRRFTYTWNRNIKQKYNNKCILTNKECGINNGAVHHLYGFNMIVQDAHDKYNIENKKLIKNYSEEELKLLEDYVIAWHKDTNNGVLLHNDIHKLFHRSKDNGGYGSKNNTPEQFEEFKQRYLDGEFNDLLGGDLDD